MIAFRLLSALGLLQLSTYSVHAGSVLSCDEQRGCFVYTIEKITSSTCDVTGDCLFTACINVNIGLDDCDKEDGISHICDQSGTDTCPLMPAPTWKKDEGANGVASSMECQTGQGGQQLFWAFKDGENGTPCTTSSNFPEEIPTGGSLTCGPTTADNVCTPSQVGKECLWTITLPDCCENDICHEPGTACCPETDVCVPSANLAACGDPHMTGFLGQKFDFTGEDGGWYALIKDDNMQVNMRVTTPVPSLPEITYITGLSVLTTGADGAEHDLVIEVTDPHNLDSSCPAGVSPCLADGALTVVLDGVETLLAPGTVSLGQDVEVMAANLPGACRSFGFEKYWDMKKLEYSNAEGRRLSDRFSMDEWILADPTATNMDECMEYVARADAQEGGVFAHQSEHASFQIVTPTATIRLSHGRLHQIAMRDPTDQYDLPEHLTWQMNMAVEHGEVSGIARGVLGETSVATRDAHGEPIMTGMEAIRGTQNDYRVEGALGKHFIQDAHTV